MLSGQVFALAFTLMMVVGNVHAADSPEASRCNDETGQCTDETGLLSLKKNLQNMTWSATMQFKVQNDLGSDFVVKGMTAFHVFNDQRSATSTADSLKFGEATNGVGFDTGSGHNDYWFMNFHLDVCNQTLSYELVGGDVSPPAGKQCNLKKKDGDFGMDLFIELDTYDGNIPQVKMSPTESANCVGVLKPTSNNCPTFILKNLYQVNLKDCTCFESKFDPL